MPCSLPAYLLPAEEIVIAPREVAANHPDQITALGDDAEGLVILPVAELKRRY